MYVVNEIKKANFDEGELMLSDSASSLDSEQETDDASHFNLDYEPYMEEIKLFSYSYGARDDTSELKFADEISTDFSTLEFQEYEENKESSLEIEIIQRSLVKRTGRSGIIEY